MINQEKYFNQIGYSKRKPPGKKCCSQDCNNEVALGNYFLCSSCYINKTDFEADAIRNQSRAYVGGGNS